MIARPGTFDKTHPVRDTWRMRDRRYVPLPLLAGLGAFVATLAYLVGASLARRDAPVFAPTPRARARAPGWGEQRGADTLTLDATDGARWSHASLALGRAVSGDSSWDLAARRYRITVAGALADLGPMPFERARVPGDVRFVPSVAGEIANEAIAHWYRYGLVTHLLEPAGHVYALRTTGGALWKLQVIGYYCPGLVAGCLTLRYAPLAPH
jgi:hypothetical protein